MNDFLLWLAEPYKHENWRVVVCMIMIFASGALVGAKLRGVRR